MKIVVTNDAGDTIATYEILVVNMGDKILEAWHQTLDGMDLAQCTGCNNWFGVDAFMDASGNSNDEDDDWCMPCLLRLGETKTLFDGADDERRA